MNARLCADAVDGTGLRIVILWSLHDLLPFRLSHSATIFSTIDDNDRISAAAALASAAFVPALSRREILSVLFMDRSLKYLAANVKHSLTGGVGWGMVWGMAIVTNAVRQKHAQEAAERRDPTIGLVRQEQNVAWEGLRTEIKTMWPVITDDNLDEVEDYRNRRAREIENALRLKYQGKR